MRAPCVLVQSRETPPRSTQSGSDGLIVHLSKQTGGLPLRGGSGTGHCDSYTSISDKHSDCHKLFPHIKQAEGESLEEIPIQSIHQANR